jgi:hypothetical protein
MGGETPNGSYGPPQIRGSELTAKSFVRNILQITHCESIFCGDHNSYGERNLLKIKALTNKRTDIASGQNERKSIFRNILRTSPYLSIFCADLEVSNFLSYLKSILCKECQKARICEPIATR